jgi:hypothetical protein
VPGVSRVELTGSKPFIEFRTDLVRYFVCFPREGVELVMGFECKHTAREIAANVCAGTPFFTAIPVVPYRTEYPRPWLVYPKVREIRDAIHLEVVDTGTLKR